MTSVSDLDEPRLSPQLARAERLLRRTRVRRRGLVVAVRTADGTRAWARGDLPAGERSVFEIGSVTKTFTALLLADLARGGVVGLDDPVGKHLPVAPPMRGRPITLADLATHHSGLPRLPAGLARETFTARRHDPYAHLDEATLAQAVRRTAPKRAPGERFGYSNLGAGLLGWALARAAQTTYPALVAQRITGPMRLADTAIELAAPAGARVATPHGWWGREAAPWHLAALAGAGGLRSSAADLLDYLAVFTDAARGPLAEAAALTRAPRHDVGRLRVGLGWMIAPGGGSGSGGGAGGRGGLRLAEDLLFHDGGTGGYRSFVAVAPASGVRVVVLTNQARGVTGLGLGVVRALLAG